MNRTKLGLIIGAGLIAIALAGYGLGLFGKKDPREAAREQREALLQTDRENLNRADASEEEIRMALMRLASARDPGVLEQALKRAKDPSALVRSAVAYALGRFPEPRSIEALKILMADESMEVRRDAIRSLGSRPDDDRRKLLESLKNRKGQSPAEKLAVWEVLLRGDGQAKYKAEALDELLSMARSGEGGLGTQAMALLASRYRGEPRVVALLKERLQTAPDLGEKAMALNYLVVMRDPWTLSNFRKLSVDSTTPELQILGVQLLGRACPQSIWEILDEKFSGAEASPQLRSAALGALSSVGGAKATELFEKWKSQGKLKDPALQPLVDAVAERLERTKSRPGRCDSVQPSA
jgi:hypothetical protein